MHRIMIDDPKQYQGVKHGNNNHGYAVLIGILYRHQSSQDRGLDVGKHEAFSTGLSELSRLAL